MSGWRCVPSLSRRSGGDPGTVCAAAVWCPLVRQLASTPRAPMSDPAVGSYGLGTRETNATETPWRPRSSACRDPSSPMCERPCCWRDVADLRQPPIAVDRGCRGWRRPDRPGSLLAGDGETLVELDRDVTAVGLGDVRLVDAVNVGLDAVERGARILRDHGGLHAGQGVGGESSLTGTATVAAMAAVTG